VRLGQELPGILNWALEGWERLDARGYFGVSQSSRDIIREFEDLGSPIQAFLNDRCVVGPLLEIERGAAWREWDSWCQEQGREHIGVQATFGRNLRAAIPTIRDFKKKRGDGLVRMWSGFGLADSAPRSLEF
jgi:putative DNA primase/helicase